MKKYLCDCLVRFRYIAIANLLWLSYVSPAKAAQIDFILPILDGSRFIRLAEMPRPVFINFWGVECPPCVVELPMLQQFAKTNPKWTVLLISTDMPSEVFDFLERHPVSLTILRPGADVTKLMRSFGNRFAALPFSLAINHMDQICFRKLGALNIHDLTKLNQDC